jgi:hypothetical protein
VIYALEGPDRCGKTTLFKALRRSVDAAFVPGLPPTHDFEGGEARSETLWEALYDRNKVYICDRHFSVSDSVYSVIRGRKRRDYSRWFDRVVPVLVYAPIDELRKRHEEERTEFCMDAVLLYTNVVKQFPMRIVIDGMLPLEEQAHRFAAADLHFRIMFKLSNTRGEYVDNLGMRVNSECCESELYSPRDVLIKSTGGEPDGAYACHRCDNPKCMRSDHLFWGTHADNMHDAMLKRGAVKQRIEYHALCAEAAVMGVDRVPTTDEQMELTRRIVAEELKRKAHKPKYRKRSHRREMEHRVQAEKRLVKEYTLRVQLVKSILGYPHIS